jgi:myo-inositol 2-dehydrogenase / D-chiro-inositol 1-dehydrogenase
VKLKSPLHVAVLGAGRIGRVHAEHLAQRIPSARLVAVADIDRAAAEACASRFGATAHDDPRRVLEDPSVHAVVICTATDTHAALVEQCAASGKHVFCEKPIDHDLARIDRALAAVAKANVKLQVGFNRRFDPSFKRVRDAVQAGEIGDVHLVRITSRDPGPPPIAYVKVSGGLFLDMAIHDFDMARYLTGSEAKTVYATGAVRIDPAIGDAGDIDTAVTVVTFDNGAIVTIDNSRRAAYGYDQRIEVFGAKGAMWAENVTPHRAVRADENGIHASVPMSFFMDRYTDSFVAEMTAFVEAVLLDHKPPVSGDDGRAPVLIALAAKRSLAERRVITLGDIPG